MNPTPALGLPASFQAAAQRIKLAAREAAGRAADNLGVSALSTTQLLKRDAMLAAQFELNRRRELFGDAFDEALDGQIEREVQPRSTSPGLPSPSSWDALSLVDERQVEREIAAQRCGRRIGQDCEAEQRELDAFVGSVLQSWLDTPNRNPLRPEIIGQAVMQAVDRVTDRNEWREVMAAELARCIAGELPKVYAAIVAELRAAGVAPVAPSVRQSDRSGTRSRSGVDTFSPPGGVDDPARDSRSGMPPFTASGHGRAPGDSRSGGFASSGAGRMGTFGASGSEPRGAVRGTPLGSVDAGLMALIRELAVADPGGGFDASGFMGEAAGPDSRSGAFGTHPGPLAPNLIRVHRDALRQASTGALDHMVIDVVGSLFDQILSDAKVPPQLARQIARLQLPVLRAALGDPTFFSSRRHPVRRLVNRIASLGTAFDDLDTEAGRRFVALVRELVQEIVEGDFDQIEVYERKLRALERFALEQAGAEVQATATHLLAQKETDLRLQQRYMQQLRALLGPLPMPDFVRDFLTQVWSQALMRATQLDGDDSARVKRLRHAGRELMMSVQPKGSPEQRKAFLMQLPTLMKELNEGLDLIHWDGAARKQFFGRLLPAHAESLKGQALSTLEYNLLVRQADTALGEAMPSVAELPPTPPGGVPVLRDEVILPAFSAEERQRLGLVDEAAVDWDGKVDIDLGEPELRDGDLDIAGLPKAEAPEPASGKSLADHVQIGFAYQMHLNDKWQKVRLVHVSPGRTFFVFTHGSRHKQTISMTYRMLARLCEAGRLRAFENAYLIERATARARRQLAALGTAVAAAH